MSKVRSHKEYLDYIDSLIDTLYEAKGGNLTMGQIQPRFCEIIAELGKLKDIEKVFTTPSTAPTNVQFQMLRDIRDILDGRAKV
jgi:hypothetical protein